MLSDLNPFSLVNGVFHFCTELVEEAGTHLRRDTVIPQWFQASKAAAVSDWHTVHC